MPEQQEEFLRSLHRDYAAVLWRFAVRLGGDRELADDVVQETLLRAWQHPAVLERDDPAVRAWLFTVARNLIIDNSRRASNRHEIGTEKLPESVGPDETDQVLDAWLMADALAELSDEHRQVIVHAYYQRENTAEMARSLDIPEGTVKSRLHYGLLALKLALQERGVTR